MLPMLNVTVPVIFPGVVGELTVAVSVVVPPNVNELGDAESDTIVAAAIPVTVSVVLPSDPR